MSKKNYDTIGNRTRDLPVFSAVPQPTAPPREAVKRYNDREETHKEGTKGKQRKEIKDNRKTCKNISVLCEMTSYILLKEHRSSRFTTPKTFVFITALLESQIWREAREF